MSDIPTSLPPMPAAPPSAAPAGELRIMAVPGFAGAAGGGWIAGIGGTPLAVAATPEALAAAVTAWARGR